MTRQYVERVDMVDEKGWKITFKEYLMGRDKAVTPTKAEIANMTRLLRALNIVRHAYGQPMKVSSGWRPSLFNKAAGGASKSAHLTGEACDFVDQDGSLAQWCRDNIQVLEDCGLYMEDPEFTKGWIHLQIRRPASGNRIFKP